MKYIILLILIFRFALFGNEPIEPIPLHVKYDEKKAQLG